MIIRLLVPSFALIVLLATQLSNRAMSEDHRPFDLCCEWATRPLNVDRKMPRLSWKVPIERQSAFQIQVASTSEALLIASPDLWDSQKVVRTDSVSIPYQGQPLDSRQTCYWRVRVWEAEKGIAGPWSVPAVWEMGLLKPDDWQAKWIKGDNQPVVDDSALLRHWYELAGHTFDQEGQAMNEGAERLRKIVPATWFRKSFHIEKPIAKARLYSTAAGYAELFLDGKPLSRRIMNPAQTDFDQRILYDVDAIESRLPVGDHILTAHLGQGFYGQNAGFGTKFDYGDPQLLIQLEITYLDGSKQVIATDQSWLSHPSPVIKNNVYAGEVYDGRVAVNNGSKPLPGASQGDWTPVVVLPKSPTKELQAQRLPPVEMVRDVRPVQIFEPQKDVWVYDFGQNFTGVPTLNLTDLSLEPGRAIFLRYSEWADDEGRIDQSSDGSFATGVHQVDCYIAGNRSVTQYTPSFTWHGFRYVEVSGLKQKPSLDMMTGHLVRSGVERRGTFVSSDEHLNRVHATAMWTYESNLVSIPSDCPIRERCGWTGDAHATLTSSNYNFDMGSFWEKYLLDFATSPHLSPAIVPGRRGGNSSPDWAVAQVLIAWEHFLHDGDTQTVREHYPRLKIFMNYFHSLVNQHGVITQGYGDWCDPVRVPGMERVGGRGVPQQTPPAITTTGLFVYASDLMIQIAKLNEDHSAASKYENWRDAASAAFHAQFFQPETSSYGSQTADAMALSFKIVPERLRAAVAESLNRDVLENWNGHASVGALGHRWLYPMLGNSGHADTALGTFFAKGHPGFYYLFDDLKGTTLWERKGAFDPATMKAPVRSLSHPFQGGYDSWFYEGLAGIRPDADHPGYKHFFLQPCFPRSLDWIKVDFVSPYGLLQSHWQRNEKAVAWNVTVPMNTTATIRLPGTPLDGRELEPGTHELEVQVGSGSRQDVR